MYSEKIGQALKFDLKHIGYNNFLKHENFQGITSPFSRMYLVIQGRGKLITGDGQMDLRKGSMYLIPSFTPCSYFFNPGLQIIFVHFVINLKDGLDLFNLMTFYSQVETTDFIQCLFNRLREINPNNSEVSHHDPTVHKGKPWVNQSVCFESLKHHLETTSLLGQLLSNFIQTDETPVSTTKVLRHGLQPILNYIMNNLDKEIKVEQLAAMACFSPDHFTRTFKATIGMCPNEYIIAKRIEKAQALLLTTRLSQSEIMEESGIRNTSYFTRIFKKHTNQTPSEFRKMHWTSN